MKISGFTFIRNGNKLDYPYLEAIKSILPICDEVIVVVGDCEDGTRETIVALAEPKIKIVDTVWDETMREGGKILAYQTNIAMDHITGDWGFYIQGDEVIHEKYLDTVRTEMQRYLNNQEVEGLLFGYQHFYGSYKYVGDSHKWYRREIRVIRNDKKIRSYLDAQGFRKDGEKLKVKLIDAEIYHYGWVRDPRAQQLKNKTFNRYWHNDEWIDQNVADANQYDYNLLESLKEFAGTQPAVMEERIKRMQWEYQYDPSRKKTTTKDKFKNIVEMLTGYRLGEYKNYKII
jgi:glycosyltransferase involved in cell wall biosynthesis